MAGIPGSHSGSLADPNAAANAAQAAQAATQPLPQAPAPSPAPQASGAPDYEAIFNQTQSQAPAGGAQPDYEAIFNQTQSVDSKMPPKFNADDFGNAGLDKAAKELTPGIVKGAVNQLPMAGSLLGGAGGAAIGTLAEGGIPGPGTAIGSVAGGSAGKLAGESLRQAILKSLGDPDAAQTRDELYKKYGKTLVSGAIENMGGQLAGKVLSALPKAAAWAGSKLSGLSKMSVKTYAKSADEVKTFIDTYGEELQGASDAFKQKELLEPIQATKQQLSGQISKALGETKEAVNLDPVLNSIDKTVSNVSEANAKLRPEDIQALQDLRAKIRSIGNNVNQTSLQNLHDIKGYLYDEAEGAYASGGGAQQVAPGKGTFYQEAVKKAGREAKVIMDAAAPELKEANEQLSNFHDLKNEIGKSLVNQSAGDSAIVQAGRGLNGKAMGDLDKIGQMTGTDPLAKAQIYAAAKDFAKTEWVNGIHSPAAVKVLIDAGRFAAPLVKSLGGPEKMMTISQTPYGQVFLGQLLKKVVNNEATDKFVNQFQKQKPIDVSAQGK